MKRAGVHISSTSDIKTCYLNDISTDTRRHLLTEKNQGMMGTGRVYFKSETSIFTYRSINKSIDISTDRQNGQREISVVQNISGRIN